MNNLILKDALSAAEKVVKEVLINLASSSDDPELVSYCKNIPVFKKFPMQSSSLIMEADSASIAFIDNYSLEIKIGTDESTNLTAPYNYVREYNFSDEDAKIAVLEFQSLINKLFASIIMTFQYLLRNNKIVDKFTVDFDKTNGRTYFIEKTNKSNTQFLYIDIHS